MQTECELKNGISGRFTASRSTHLKAPSWYETLCRRPVIIDECSRKLFPIVFIFYNCAYWIIYMNISQTANQENGYISID